MTLVPQNYMGNFLCKYWQDRVMSEIENSLVWEVTWCYMDLYISNTTYACNASNKTTSLIIWTIATSLPHHHGFIFLLTIAYYVFTYTAMFFLDLANGNHEKLAFRHVEWRAVVVVKSYRERGGKDKVVRSVGKKLANSRVSDWAPLVSEARGERKNIEKKKLTNR